MTNLKNGECGSAILEFALLLPILASMLVGILSYGLYFGAAHSVQQLAADAARRSVAGSNAAERSSIVHAYVDANATGYFLIRADRLREVSATAIGDGRTRIRIAFDATWLPIFSFAAMVPLPPGTITRDCTILDGEA
ncbi:MAG: pilus assembly protein [Sphingomonas sp.]|nr:pilus assembly protein [Sphingomonas sp.]